MKIHIIIFLALLTLTCTLHSQTKTIKGQLKYNDQALSGIRFTVEDKGISGTTDKNGYFVLANVTDNDIINSSKGTFRVGDVIVSVLSTQSVQAVSSLLGGAKDTIGVLYMSDDIPFLGFSGGSVYDIHSFSKKGKGYRINEMRGKYKTYGYKLSYSSYIDITSVGRLPKLQSTYAQGQGNNWQGADKAENFSWGPKVSDLEYSNNAYPYDKNGSLVAAGTGNGAEAKTYDPTDFFRTGILFGNSVNVKFPGFSRGVSTINIGQRKHNSPIPNAYKESYNISAGMQKIKSKHFTSKLGVVYNSSYGRLTEQGANLSTLMHSVFSTPPTFDNANGLLSKQAVRNNEAWMLNDGTMRSYNPSQVNNPYMLVNELPDREKSENILAYARTEYSLDRLTASASLSFDKQWDKLHNGMIGPEVCNNSFKREHLSNIIANGNFSYRLPSDENEYHLVGNYGFKRTTNKLFKENSFATGYPWQKYFVEDNLTRNVHDLKYGAKFRGGDYYSLYFNSSLKYHLNY